MAKTQHDTFIDIKRLSDDINSLAAFVQNDFEEMIADGYVTRDEISQSAEEAANAFDRCITKLANLRTEVLAVLANYSSSGTH
jgi:hypothetical protein